MIKPTTNTCLLLFSICLLVSNTFNSSLRTFNHVLTCLHLKLNICNNNNDIFSVLKLSERHFSLCNVSCS